MTFSRPLPSYGRARARDVTQRQYSVRASVVLNNTAVTLFAELHCYRQAHLVLKDAVATLQRSSSKNFFIKTNTPAGLAVSQHSSSSKTSVEDRLRRASQWIINPEASFAFLFPIQAVSDDSWNRVPLHQHKLCDNNNSKDPFFKFLRIEANDFEEPSEDRVMAVATYNYGLSLLCHATLISSSSPHRVKFLVDAAKVLRHSSNFARFMIGEEEEGLVLFVSLLIEKTLVQILFFLGCDIEARRRLVCLGNISNQLDSANRLLQAFECSTKVAPAA